jgi:hypothetical protein
MASKTSMQRQRFAEVAAPATKSGSYQVLLRDIRTRIQAAQIITGRGVVANTTIR